MVTGGERSFSRGPTAGRRPGMCIHVDGVVVPLGTKTASTRVKPSQFYGVSRHGASSSLVCPARVWPCNARSEGAAVGTPAGHQYGTVTCFRAMLTHVLGVRPIRPLCLVPVTTAALAHQGSSPGAHRAPLEPSRGRQHTPATAQPAARGAECPDPYLSTAYASPL